MFNTITFYFANTNQAARELVVMVMAAIIAMSWIPSHYFFKWLRKSRKVHNVTLLSILVCLQITVILIATGIWVGNIITDPSLRSLGSSANVNMWWFPFGLLSLGVWSGFLSGYKKMKISGGRWF